MKELKAWPEIPTLQNTAGLALHDTTSFDLPANWTAARRAHGLHLGEVFDSFTVTINNQAVAMDQISAEGDVGAFLKAGRNTIVVRVATTLNNRLTKLDEAVAQRGLVQPYGLVGPVVLTPYTQAVVWRKSAAK
ncbi:MAG: hypothetical protein U0Y68_13835 [Blastocatellia bacterium]